ncbi:MAG: FG-GAP repeat domain-containing protein [Limisphaerales bacterium]
MPRATSWGLLIGLLLGVQSLASAPQLFGFQGPEAFPLEYGIAFLQTTDLDGDGLQDVVVVNNARSRIHLLYNRTGNTNSPVTPLKVGRSDINQLLPDARFRLESMSSEKRITSMVVADLNHDDRPDLAYFGEPKELVLQHNLGTNGWSQPKRWPLDDGTLDFNALTAGDLNGDGRKDLVLLAEKHLYLIRQQPDGTLAEPERLPYTGTIRAIQVLDLNRDGRQDLLLVNWDSSTPFRFRLQREDGQFEPEVHLPLNPIRSYCAEDLDGDGIPEIVCIAAKSGRASLYHLNRKAAEPLVEGLKDGQFSLLPLTRTDKARRGTLWTDLDGNSLTDLLVADPGSGQLSFWRRRDHQTLEEPRNFPCLTGISDLAAADWDRDGQIDLFLLSPDERQLGVTRLDAQGRLPFPSLIPLTGRPLAMTVGGLSSNQPPTLAVIQERDEKRQGSSGKEETIAVRELVLRAADGTTTTQRLSEDFKGGPARLAIHDANQDGRPDVVILTPYERIKILVQRDEPKDGARFEEADVTPPGGSLESPWMLVADVDQDGKDELILPQKSFLRAVVLAGTSGDRASWNFVVRDQINGATGTSRITGAAVVEHPRGSAPWLILLDADRKALSMARRDTNGVWQIARNSQLTSTEFNSLIPVSVGTNQPPALALIGANAIGWKQFGGNLWELGELGGYETPIRDGWLHDVTTGDLNQDGRKDLVFLETAKNYVDLVLYDPVRGPEPGNRWPVFEERTFRQRRNDVPEPREAAVSDVTGDGKPDLLLIVHDRILLYPQE